MFYREARPPLLGFALYDEFISVAARLGGPSPDAPDDETVAELQRLLQALPAGHLQLMSHLVSFLGEVVSFTLRSQRRWMVMNRAVPKGRAMNAKENTTKA